MLFSDQMQISKKFKITSNRSQFHCISYELHNNNKKQEYVADVFHASSRTLFALYCFQ